MSEITTRLEFKRPVLSISQFDPVILPGFAILTGQNGAGKSHLLQAIRSSQVSADGLAPHDIALFDANSFKGIATTLDGERGADWTPSNWWKWLSKSRFFASAKLHFDHHFSGTDPELIDWDDEADENVQTYWRSVISEIPAPHSGPTTETDSPDIVGAIERFSGPAHLMTESDFERNLQPSIFKGKSSPTLQLSSLFTAYKRRQFEWVTQKIDQDLRASKSELLAEYEELFPPPWAAIDAALAELRAASGTTRLFDFRVTRPTEEFSLANWRDTRFKVQVISNSTGTPVSPTQLSSGELVILGLLAFVFASREKHGLPKLLLLDEIDASLHPSIINLLIHVIEKSLLPRGCRVVLATHSPTTVALAPERSLFEVVRGPALQKIVKRSRAQLLDSLTEGFVTIDLAGRVFSEVAKGRLTIITEGHNRSIVARALELFGVTSVEVLAGVESRTGATQLKTLFDFFALIPHHPPVLFVWDCDFRSIPPDTGSTFGFGFQKNDENNLIEKGIENLFDKQLFEGRTKITILANKREIVNLDESQKEPFATHIAASTDKHAYRRFEPLVRKVEKILSTSTSIR